MFQALISPIASLAGTWLEGKVSKAKAETEVKVARAKLKLKFTKQKLHQVCLMSNH